MREMIENKLKSLDFVEKFHIETVKHSNINRNVSAYDARLKIRVWLISHLYTAHILSEDEKIEDVVRKANIHKIPYVLDVYIN